MVSRHQSFPSSGFRAPFKLFYGIRRNLPSRFRPRSYARPCRIKKPAAHPCPHKQTGQTPTRRFISCKWGKAWESGDPPFTSSPHQKTRSVPAGQREFQRRPIVMSPTSPVGVAFRLHSFFLCPLVSFFPFCPSLLLLVFLFFLRG